MEEKREDVQKGREVSKEQSKGHLVRRSCGLNSLAVAWQ
jgi:hypothetical protein